MAGTMRLHEHDDFAALLTVAAAENDLETFDVELAEDVALGEHLADYGGDLQGLVWLLAALHAGL
jgi:hypothetical protein